MCQIFMYYLERKPKKEQSSQRKERIVGWGALNSALVQSWWSLALFTIGKKNSTQKRGKREAFKKLISRWFKSARCSAKKGRGGHWWRLLAVCQLQKKVLPRRNVKLWCILSTFHWPCKRRRGSNCMEEKLPSSCFHQFLPQFLLVDGTLALE